MKPKVVVAESLAEAGIRALEEHCRVDVAVGVDRSELISRVADAAGLIVRSATRVDRELLEAAPSLKVVGRAGIGVDNIDLEAATERGVLVVNAPHANTISAAEHTMALLLAQARNIARADQTLRSGVWDRSRFQGVELHGKTLGVVGLGKIGTLVAQRASAFGMRLLAYDPFVSEERARRLGVELVDFDRLLAESDFITVHLPKTKDTAGLIGKEALEKVKPGVRIVNTSRGGIVDEEALAEAIRQGRVAGAALDVFEHEPLTDSPLFELPQVVVTPHLGASTAEAQDKAGVDVARAVAAALRGELVLTAVNVDLGRELADEMRAYLPLAELLGRAFVGLAKGLPGHLTVRAEGLIARHDLQPLKLAVLKGAMEAVSNEPVSYVNAPRLAEGRGIRVETETSEESLEYLSTLRVLGKVDRPVSITGTVGRKGPMMVEIMGHEVELPFSPHVLIVRNQDVPGVIGRVGTYLGSLQVNIANMVVGRSPKGEAAMMGLNLDQPLTEDQVEGVKALPGIEEARYLDLS
ncbi:MAG: D-3-phosphoglycerate dehydrogenase [Acidimicrobiia bacterium]|nr:MAG: D-3-phosphoglycerate dehydrogenase [Acidimicrobiia bacterium]